MDEIVTQAGLCSSAMIPSPCAFLSVLLLKLLDKERQSHIDDFNFDRALGLFAGLNILPKKTFLTDFSYRHSAESMRQLLGPWASRLRTLLTDSSSRFSLDFHPIVHRGEDSVLENHYIPCAGQAASSIQTFFVLECDSRVFCYANANLTRDEQATEVMRFVDFWSEFTGSLPSWLYFDSKVTTYAELSRLNERGIHFVTIRRRGSRLVARLAELPSSAWTKAVIDIPKRRHKEIGYHDERVRLGDYQGQVRQIAVRGLGRELPTLFLTNNFDIAAREAIINYAKRNGIEDGLGTNVDFFHLDCLSSEVRLNVQLDVASTVLAQGCYRWLASKLKGYENAKAKQLFRHFVETSGEIEWNTDGQLKVVLDRRSHNPILREAELDQECPTIPWLHNARLKLTYR